MYLINVFTPHIKPHVSLILFPELTPAPELIFTRLLTRDRDKCGLWKLGRALRTNWSQTSTPEGDWGLTCRPFCPSHMQTGSLPPRHKHSACAHQAQTSTSIRQGAKVTGRETCIPQSAEGALRPVSRWFLAFSRQLMSGHREADHHAELARIFEPNLGFSLPCPF